MLSDAKETIAEVVQATLPIVTVILIIQIVLLDYSISSTIQFIIGSAMLIIGMALFLLGVKVGLLPMGEAVGSEIPKYGSVVVIAIIAFLFGLLVTIAEPDVRVLTSMIETISQSSIQSTELILIISGGTGFFVSAAILRIIYNVPIAYLFATGYIVIIGLSFFTSPDYIPIAFDSGGVATGPINLPFILALGTGVTAVLGGRSQLSDGFGLVGLASMGSVIGVLLMGIFLV
jgi:hypothetical protein